jgi:hypothetical protein
MQSARGGMAVRVGADLGLGGPLQPRTAAHAPTTPDRMTKKAGEEAGAAWGAILLVVGVGGGGAAAARRA